MKIHSIRSTVAFILASVFLLLIFPWQAFAATTLNTGTVVISDTQQQGTYDILYDGLDIYLQAADFEKITRYTYQETEEAVAYTLGQKTLAISKSGKHTVQIPALGVYENYGLTLKGIVQSGGKTYISVSELLPWLNVSVSEKDGILIVVPDDISFWEVCADLNSSKDLFNLSKDFGDSAISKTGLAAMLTYNMVTSLKIDNVLDNAPTDAVISSYEKIYVDMATDETLLSGEANAFVNKIYTANNNIDTVEKVFGVNEGAFHNKATQTLLEQGMTDEWQAFEDFAATWNDVRTTISAAKTVADYLPLLKTMKLLETQFYMTQDYKTYLSKLTKSGTRTGVEALALKKVNAELETRQSAAEVTLLSSLTKNLRKVLQNPQVSDNPFCEDISLYLIASNLFYSTILTVNPAFSDMSNIATYSSIMNRSWNEGEQYTSQVATKDNLLMATESYKVALKASKTCFNTLQKTTDIRLLGFIKVLGDTSTLMKYRTDPIDQKIAALSVTAKYRENDSVEGKKEYKKTIRENIKKCQVSMNGEAGSATDDNDSEVKESTTVQQVWAREPYLDCEEIEPLFTGILIDDMIPGLYQQIDMYSNYIITSNGGNWNVYDVMNEQYIVENQSTYPPTVCGICKGLFSRDEKRSESELTDINNAITAMEAPFHIGNHPHGAVGSFYVYSTQENTVYLTYSQPGPLESEPVAAEQNTLLRVQVGNSVDESDFGGSIAWEPSYGTPYAIAPRTAVLVTDFIYQNVAMPTKNLIAVQNSSGYWGYVDASGTEVIPCEYQPVLHYGWKELSCPAPELYGKVVLKDKNNQYLVKNISGDTLIEPGSYEKLAPALQQDCVWAKQNGKWGLLKIVDANMSADTSAAVAAYKNYFYDHFTENDYVYLADVTHDGVEDMLVVQKFSDNEYLLYAWIFTIEDDGMIKEIYQERTGIDHTSGFFNWFIKISDDGTANLGREYYGLWQGYGAETFVESYFDNEGNEYPIEQIEVNSDDPSSVGADGAVTSEAMRKFNEQVFEYKKANGFCKIYESYSSGPEYAVSSVETTPSVVFAG